MLREEYDTVEVALSAAEHGQLRVRAAETPRLRVRALRRQQVDVLKLPKRATCNLSSTRGLKARR